MKFDCVQHFVPFKTYETIETLYPAELFVSNGELVVKNSTSGRQFIGLATNRVLSQEWAYFICYGAVKIEDWSLYNRLIRGNPFNDLVIPIGENWVFVRAE